MKTKAKDFDTHLSSSLQGEELEFDLSETILNRVLVINEKERKRCRKEAIAVAIYIVLTIGLVLVLFFMKAGSAILPDFSFPEVSRLTFSRPDITIYYRAAIVISAISLICFVTYFTKLKAST